MAPEAEGAAESLACWACGGGDVGEAPEFRPVVLARCGRCGFLFQPARSFADVRALYGDEYFEAYPTGAGAGREEAYAEDDEARWFEARVRVRLLTDAGVRGGRLLEVGAAAGHFLAAAREARFDVLGVEPSPAVAARGRERFGVEVLDGYVEEVELAHGPFDVACAWHVVEHLVDPATPLRRVRDALRPGGAFLAEVPNVESVRARRERAGWGPLDPAHHVGFYGPRSLRALLERCGFAVERTETVMPGVYRPALRRTLSYAKQAVVLRGWPFGPHPWKHELLRVVARRPDGSDRP